MPAAGLLALLDDLASVLDDVAVMSKLATKKTMAIAGDDLAVGAESLVGLDPSRELPIVWKVTKGSLFNKAWLVPLALALSILAPGALTPLLMIGGAFLCYEGVHKILEKLGIGHHEDAGSSVAAAPVQTPDALERARVRGAIRTDMILSAEIVVIAINALAEFEFVRKTVALVVVAFGLTFAIYGLIAAIVKADDLGLHLVRRGGAWKGVGRAILATMPPFMKLIGVVGTVAMFLVGGGIIEHGIPPLEHAVTDVVNGLAAVDSGLNGVLKQVAVLLVGVVTGFLALGLWALVSPLVKRLRRKTA
jgi:predicted DNA repair protein MutK